VAASFRGESSSLSSLYCEKTSRALRADADDFPDDAGDVRNDDFCFYGVCDGLRRWLLAEMAGQVGAGFRDCLSDFLVRPADGDEGRAEVGGEN